MTYLVTKTYGHDLGLSACFRQHRALHSHCSYLHGYALAFTFTFSANKLDERNWVIDFGGLKWLKKWLTETFDHKLFVAADDPYIDELMGLGPLGLADPMVIPNVGCEQFAKLAALYVMHYLNDNYQTAITHRELQLRSVECREHGSNSATYEVI